MPRRTKLIISALVILLLGIPSLYVALVWRPASPLRFSLGETEPPESNDPGEWRKVKVLITNTSSTTIHLQIAQLEDLKLGGAGGHPDAGLIFPGPWGTLHPLIIPPRGSVDRVTLFQAAALESSQRDRFMVHYTWSSQLKAKYNAARNGLCDYLPRPMWNVLPPFFPDTDTALLEFPDR